MRLRLTKVDEYQFLISVKNKVWGSKLDRFGDWQVGDFLAITVDKNFAALGEVMGKPYVSDQIVWDNGLFPHRIDLHFTNALQSENRLPILGEVRDALTSAWGPSYGWGIRNQQVLEGLSAETVIKAIRSRPNDLEKIQANIEQLLHQARTQRDSLFGEKRKPRVQKVPLTKKQEEQERFESKKEESEHSRAQSNLIKLGKITGCSVWLASNDRNRKFDGKTLGEGCLKSLPNMGLSDEARNRISLIDTIWIQQNNPVCAFEVESTTSIYSGLLRMSDLISVIPALRIKLFIVAPRDRQAKVMSELARPTFQKIGLSEFCRFIPLDDIGKLLTKIEDLQGYVQPSIIDTIAIALEEDEESSLN